MLEQGAELLAYAKKCRRSRWVKERRVRPGSFAINATRIVAPLEEKGIQPIAFSNQWNSLGERISLFRELVRNRNIHTYFQPIVSLEGHTIYGYEALLRGPSGTYFESPVILFSMARETEMVLELDLLSFQKVLELMGDIPSPLKLFFNVTPESFYSPMFREIMITAMERASPGRIVLEVTRKRRIQDYEAFRNAAAFFKEKGFGLAVDDAQSGTLSLHTILALMPEFIKVDTSVVRGITQDKEKQRVFRQLMNYCEKQGAELIAEGVESNEEEGFIKRQGARLAQGFLFAPPRPPPLPRSLDL
jgi:EAL domain-containing protein (putative c-di-GMP-specific phosphodiesterase class I)